MGERGRRRVSVEERRRYKERKGKGRKEGRDPKEEREE